MLKALKPHLLLSSLLKHIRRPPVQYILALLMVAALVALVACRLLVVSNAIYPARAQTGAKQDRAVQQCGGNPLRMSIGAERRAIA